MIIFLIVIIVIDLIWMGVGLYGYLTGKEWSKTSEDMEADFIHDWGDGIIEGIRGKTDKKEVRDEEDKAL